MCPNLRQPFQEARVVLLRKLHDHLTKRCDMVHQQRIVREPGRKIVQEVFDVQKVFRNKAGNRLGQRLPVSNLAPEGLLRV